MKSYKGILLLTVSIVLTVYVWLATGMTNFVTPGLALTTLSWTFMLATRSRLLEKLFNGIERMYAIHKFLPSYQLFSLSSTTSVWGVYRVHLAGQLGTLEYILLGKSLKYETWHWLHRLVYLAYIFGLSHVYLIIVFLFHFHTPSKAPFQQSKNLLLKLPQDSFPKLQSCHLLKITWQNKHSYTLDGLHSAS